MFLTEQSLESGYNLYVSQGSSSIFSIPITGESPEKLYHRTDFRFRSYYLVPHIVPKIGWKVTTFLVFRKAMMSYTFTYFVLSESQKQ